MAVVLISFPGKPYSTSDQILLGEQRRRQSVPPQMYSLAVQLLTNENRKL